jgi:hypothetical protein
MVFCCTNACQSVLVFFLDWHLKFNYYNCNDSTSRRAKEKLVFSNKLFHFYVSSKFFISCSVEELDCLTVGYGGTRLTEIKQHSQKSVSDWWLKIYYLRLPHVSEGALSRWFQLHLQSLTILFLCCHLRGRLTPVLGWWWWESVIFKFHAPLLI